MPLVFNRIANALTTGLAIVAWLTFTAPILAQQSADGPRRALPFYGVGSVAEALRDPVASAQRLEKAGAPSAEFRRIMSQCGKKLDWQEVELYTGTLGGKPGPTRQFVNEHQSPVAQLQWRSDLATRLGANGIAGNVAGVRWCTGTLIGSNLLLTAAHCFEPQNHLQGWQTPRRKLESPGPDGKSWRLLTAAELAPLIQLNFNYEVNGDDPLHRVRRADIYPIVRLREYGFGNADNPVDYAIVEVGPDNRGQLPSDKFGVMEFDAGDAALKNATFLTMIQHPHGEPKKIMAGAVAGMSNNGLLLYKDLDTLGGSSGSGVIAETGKLIAVHVQGGCMEYGGANRGVPLTTIRKVSHIIN